MKILKSIFVALFLISLSVTTSNASGNSANTLSCQRNSEVTATQVSAYLQAHRHTVLSTPYSNDGGYTWYVLTSFNGHNWNTTVFCNATSIVDYDDVPA